ncbi:MAG TPA: hypothetical protein VEA78_12675, partial [Acidimicrobiales bacterium]|nr:hypothetical protein [Acidimicrobiales bacterium]
MRRPSTCSSRRKTLDFVDFSVDNQSNVRTITPVMSDLADVEVNGSNLADAIAARDLLDAKITVAVGVFDASGEWELDGAVSCTQWLRANAGMRGAEAGAIVKRARKLRSLPTFAEAWLHGRSPRRTSTP